MYSLISIRRPNSIARILLSFVLVLFIYHSTSAQCTGNLVLKDQAAIDTFNCNYIIGNLTIRDGIHDLTALSILDSVGGNIIIKNTTITDLNGLENLVSANIIRIEANTFLENIDALSSLKEAKIEIYQNELLKNLNGLSNFSPLDTSSISIGHNKSLKNLSGLSGLTIVENLRVFGNDSLTSLMGVENITTITNQLSISDNESLPHLDPLNGLTSVQGLLSIQNNLVLRNIDGLDKISSSVQFLTIYGNTSLLNLDGLANLSSVGFWCSIIGNDSLRNLQGLKGLNYIGRDLKIQYNKSLKNLDGLEELNSIKGSLYIQWNDSLKNVNGLSNLTSIGRNLIITQNHNLDECCGFYPILNSGTIGSGVIIVGNKTGCNVADILSNSDCKISYPIVFIQSLKNDSTLNKGQANALIKKLNRCNLNALFNQAQAFVNSGIITQSQADDIVAGATAHCGSGARIIENISSVEFGKAYPNPANSATMVPFSLTQDVHVNLTLFDAQGKKILTALDQIQPKGKHEIKISLTEFKSGIYFCRLQVRNEIHTQILMIKR